MDLTEKRPITDETAIKIFKQPGRIANWIAIPKLDLK